jgi:hypothetical protein
MYIPGYDDQLAWYQSNSLASAKEVKCVEFKHLVGTLAPMVSVERVGKHVALYYKWDHPPTQHVVSCNDSCLLVLPPYQQI